MIGLITVGTEATAIAETAKMNRWLTQGIVQRPSPNATGRGPMITMTMPLSENIANTCLVQHAKR